MYGGMMAQTWYTTLSIQGEPYPTRYYAPEIWNIDDAWSFFTLDQADYMSAIHEAGHAVVGLLGQYHIHSAELFYEDFPTAVGGTVTACRDLDADEDGHAFAAFGGAGERAANKWLHEAHLWTPQRAVTVELCAWKDRALLLESNPHVGFGDRADDYRAIHDIADQVINRGWSRIKAVADAARKAGLKF